MSSRASFHSSTLDRDQLGAIMQEYLALEQAHVYRRLLVRRCGLLVLALGVIGIGFHWLPPSATWTSVGLCLIAPLWAWMTEVRCDRRLARRLEQVCEPHACKKVVKSS